MKVFKLMNNLMKIHLPFILLSLLMSLFTILSNIGMLSTSSVLISRAALHPEVLDLMVLIVAVRFFGISRGVFRYLERIISHNTTFKILSSLRKWFYCSFNDSYSESKKHFKTGNIYTKLVNDIDTLKEFFLRVIYPLITAVLTGLVTAIFISYFSKESAIMYILIYMLSGFVVPLILFSFSNRLMKIESLLKKDINLILIDLLNGILEVSIYSLQIALLSKYNKLRMELSLAQYKKNLITSLGENLYGFSISLVMTLSLYIAAPLVTNWQLSGIYYAMLPLAMMASFEALIPIPNILYKYKESYVASSDILSIINEPSLKATAKAKAVSDYKLSVESLCVAETGTNKLILKNISFQLPKGNKLAIVGMSGSGKSTLLKTLLGFMNFSSGDIKLGDISYNNLDMEEIRKQFSYIEQSPYIFNTTIKENLLIANPKAECAELSRSLKASQIEDFINNLPDGLATKLGEFGSKVSGGEKQRLALARALLKASPILLLDEPTASLDFALEKKVIESIHRFIENESCIWVTHRLVDMEKMDEIIVLHKGEIVERGTHKELLKIEGFYYKLWTMQNQYIY